MVVKYRELVDTPVWPPPPGKWKSDPDIDPEEVFAPRPKYYMNGAFLRQGAILRSKTSTNSLGERRVPRRGLIQVFPHEPDYYTLAREQGLYWLLPEHQGNQQAFQEQSQQVNGITPPSSDKSKSVSGGSPNLMNGVPLQVDEVAENNA